MKANKNLLIAAAFLAVWALAAFQGHRVDQLREDEIFYRWLIGASAQTRVFGSLESELYGDERVQMQDDELFAKVNEIAEKQLTDISVKEGDKDDEGNTYSSLIRASLRATEVGDDVVDEEEEKPLFESKYLTPAQLKAARKIWALAQSDAMADERKEFSTYLAEGRLISMGTQFEVGAMYSDKDNVVNLGNLFFGFRKLSANLLWLQVDKEWHAGNVYRILPLMHTCVALDPAFIDAYLVGAWHLAYNATANLDFTPLPEKEFSPKYGKFMGERDKYIYQAVEFLKDGIRKNPRNYKLYFDLGFSIYEEKLGDHPNAIKYLSQAIRFRHDRWVPRQLYLAMQKNGQYEEALEGWEHYLERFPDYINGDRFVWINKGRLAEQRWDAAREKEKNASSQEELEAARAERDKYEKETRDIYNHLIAQSGQTSRDEFAVCRLMRMDAIEYAEEGRYFEAIALLENARLDNPTDIFDEASDMIMEYKKRGGIALSLSEKMELLRREEAEKYRKKEEELREQYGFKPEE